MRKAQEYVRDTRDKARRGKTPHFVDIAFMAIKKPADGKTGKRGDGSAYSALVKVYFSLVSVSWRTRR
jgi:hypothetical protein